MTLAQNPTALGRARQRLRILAALVIRETSARFGRSWGGYIWAIAEPTGGIVLLSVAFSFITHVRLCCANPMRAGVTLSRDRPILRAA